MDRFCTVRTFIRSRNTRRSASTTLTLINAESLICMHGFLPHAYAYIALILIAGATSVLIGRKKDGDTLQEDLYDFR